MAARDHKEPEYQRSNANLRLIEPTWHGDGVPVCSLKCPCYRESSDNPTGEFCEAETGDTQPTSSGYVCHAAVSRLWNSVVSEQQLALERRLQRRINEGFAYDSKS